MRFLIFIVVLYVLYRVLVKPVRRRNGGQGPSAGAELDDILVKDPYCETYFSKRDGVHLRLQGSDFFFCSEKCRDRFVALHEKKT